MSSNCRPLRFVRPGTEPPGLGSAQHLRKIRAAIADNGFWIQAVQGATADTTFTYTVGLHRLHHAELVVTALGCPVGCDLVGDVAHWITDHDARFVAGQMLDVGGPIGCLVEVAQPRYWLGVARDFSMRPVTGLQLVLADCNGRLPGEMDFDEGLHQPVLGNALWTMPGWVRPEPIRLFGS